jgi:hypothetical protein
MTNACINHLSSNAKRKGSGLLNRLREVTSEQLWSDIGKGQEARRTAWANYGNISKWYDVLKQDMIDHGFGREATLDDGVEGEIFFTEAQKRRIVNLDESSFSLDGSSGRAGGRPLLVFYDPTAPRPGNITNKSAYTCTVLVAAHAAGETLPPHFQFCTAAKADEGLARWRLHAARRFHKVRAQCGFDYVQDSPVTFGKNEKGGMNTEQFH